MLLLAEADLAQEVPVAASHYGRRHRERRAALIPGALGKPCPGGCGRTLRKGMALHLDHSDPHALNPRSVGDRIVCEACNTSAGGRLGNQLRNQRPSRVW